jgi:DNA-binding beta-propeller fold protein YncE
VLVAACGSTTAAAVVPSSGLLLLDLGSGAQVASLSVGADAVAVALSEDGSVAYVADSAPGDVYAVRLSQRRVLWRSHTSGAPFGVLAHGGRVFVSLYSSTYVDELDPATGHILASDRVTPGPAALTLDATGRVAVAGTHGEVDFLDGSPVMPAGHGFGIASIGGDLWTADYERAELVRAGDLRDVGLPDPLFPFWLSAEPGGKVLVAAEGDPEDTSTGAVYEFDPSSGAFRTLARPRDPDLVVESKDTVFVAAHGDREVLTINTHGAVQTWARGAAAVALAPDPSLNLLVVAVNSHE